MEGLSLLLKEGQQKGLLTSIKVSRTLRILHIIFVDDVVIMTNATINEWWEIDKIIKKICLASNLVVNLQKRRYSMKDLHIKSWILSSVFYLFVSLTSLLVSNILGTIWKQVFNELKIGIGCFRNLKERLEIGVTGGWLWEVDLPY